MAQTTNLGLEKPAYTSIADVVEINNDMDILDTKLGAIGNTSVQNQINNINSSLNQKVDKVTGKALSTNDYSDADKTKLSNIEPYANKTDVDDELDEESENPVQNQVIVNALSGKVDKETGKGLSTNDYTTTEKNKLADIEPQANKTVVDSSVSETSTNPVQSMAIYSALNGKVDKVTGKGLSTNDFTDEDKEIVGGVTDALNGKVDKVTGKVLSSNDYTTAEKNKLSGIAPGAEVNQNAFSKVTVGSTTISADSKTDTLTIVAGSNVTLSPDATNDKLTIDATDTTYSDATTSTHGLMTAADKSKLDGIIPSTEDDLNYIVGGD